MKRGSNAGVVSVANDDIKRTQFPKLTNIPHQLASSPSSSRSASARSEALSPKGLGVGSNVSSASQLEIRPLSPDDNDEDLVDRPATARTQNEFIVLPEVVNFDNVLPGASPTHQWLTIQNRTQRVRRIRLMPPATKSFTLDPTMNPNITLAPGIVTKVRISYCGNSEIAIHDRLLVVTGDRDADRIMIPLHAYPPSADIQFDSFVNFGNAVLNATATKYVEFRNEGSRSGEFSITFEDDPPLVCTPARATLAPKGREGSIIGVRMDYNAQELGAYRTLGRVRLDGSRETNQYSMLDLSINVVEQSLQLVRDSPEGGLMKEAYFGGLYYGQKRTIKSYIVNNSPFPTHFVITQSDASNNRNGSASSGNNNNNIADDASVVGSIDDDTRSVASGADGHNSEKSSSSSYLTVLPNEGTLEPYGRQPLEFSFAPIFNAADREGKKFGFKTTARLDAPMKFASLVKIESGEQKLRVIIPMSGTASRPQPDVSITELVYNECPVHERRDIVVTLRNRSDHLPLQWDSAKIAQFSTKPSRGRLAPLQSQDILVSFVPRQMGRYDYPLPLSFEGGIFTLPLRVRGTSSSIGDRQKLIGGTEALPTDFKPRVTFVPAKQGPRPKFTRATGWKNPELATRGVVADGTWETAYTLTQDEVDMKINNRSKYDNHLKKMRSDRFETLSLEQKARMRHTTSLPSHGLKDQLKIDQLDGVSLGMAFANGLDSPEPRLPPADEKLMLQYAMSGFDGVGKKGKVTGTGAAGTAGKRGIATDLSKKASGASGKKVKTAPTTQAERKDCEASLSLDELQHVTRGAKHIDFGRICMNGIARRSLTITNQLDTRHILLTINIDGQQELSRTPLRSIMLPPGDTADFELVFMSPTPLDYKASLSYSINGKHVYSFTATAEVVAPSLNVSDMKPSLTFGSDNASFQATANLQLLNPWNVPVEYWWTTELESFSITPSKGVLGAEAKQNVVITYEPRNAEKPFTTDVVLHVTNGPDQKLSCKAGLEEATLSFKSRQLSFGTVCVGVPVSKTIMIRNTGASRAVFRIIDLPYGIKVKPSTGRLDTGASLPLVVTLSPTAAAEYKSSFTVDVRGRPVNGKPLKLQIDGRSIMPEVEVKEDELNYGGVTLGASRTLAVHLFNRGSVPVKFYLDMSSYGEFMPTFANELTDPELGESQPTKVRRAMPGGDTGAEYDPVSEPLSLTGVRGRAFYLFLAAQSTLEFNIVYRPKEIRDHQFELPLSITGLSAIASIRRVVVAEGLKPRVSVSSPAIEFGPKVMLKRERAVKHPYVNKFTLKNEQTTPLRWHLSRPVTSPVPEAAAPVTTAVVPNASPPSTASERKRLEMLEIKALRDLVWRIEPTSGTLAPGETIPITAQFAPLESIPYSLSLTLNLANEGSTSASTDDMRPYLTIPLSGDGVLPRLAFDTEEINMPIVPLGVTSTFAFRILNQGYDNLEVKYNLPPDSARVPLTLTFPEGSSIGIGRETLPVELSFMSRRPLTFQANIDFLDNDGNKFTLPINGTTDNSVLTIQPYLDTHVSDVEIRAKDGRVPQIGDKRRTPATVPSNKDLKLPLSNAASNTAATGPSTVTRPVTTASTGTTLTTAPPTAKAPGENQVRPPLVLRAASIQSVKDAAGISNSNASLMSAASAVSTAVQRTGTAASTKSLTGRMSSVMMPLDQSLRSIHAVLHFLAASSLLQPLPQSRNDALSSSRASSTLPSRASTGYSRTAATTGAIPPSSVDRGATRGGKPGVRGKTAAAAGAVPPTAGGADDDDIDEDISPTSVAGGAAAPPLDNATIAANLLSTLKEDFPAEIVRTNGRSIMNMVKSLTGQAPLAASQSARPGAGLFRAAGGTQQVKDPARADSSWAAYRDYQDFVNFLTAHGALLSAVKPQYLMSLSQYMRLMYNGDYITEKKAIQSEAESERERRTPEKWFPDASRTCWLIVLHQIVKVFIINRITLKHYKSLPGLHPDHLRVEATAVTGSNIYSVGEAIVLSWLQHHHNFNNPHSPRRVLTFDQDLSDGVVLLATIASHLPTLKSAQRVIANPENVDQRLTNARQILTAMRDIGLSYPITDEEIAVPVARDLFLFAAFLYNKLPDYVPKTVITFKGRLHEEMVKTIELTNPSKKPITYSVRLEGSTDFTVDQFNVTLQPRTDQSGGSKIKFPVRFKSRFSRPVEGRLIFTADGLSAASTLVFSLQSQIESRRAIMTHKTTARCYEQSAITIPVTNPFPMACTFHIAVNIERTPDTKKPVAAKKAAAPTRRRPRILRNGQTEEKEDDEKEGEETKTQETKTNVKNAKEEKESKWQDIEGDGYRLHTITEEDSLNGSLAGGRGDDKKAVVPVESTLPPAFWTRHEKVKIKGGDTQQITLQFLPFRIGEYRCQLLFLDEASGEFMHEIAATATSPPSTELLKWSSVSKASLVRDIIVPLRNSFLTRAREIAMDRYHATASKRHGQPTPVWVEALQRNGGASAPLPTPLEYTISSSSPYFLAPPSVVLSGNSGDEKKRGLGAARDSGAKSRAGGAIGAPVTSTNQSLLRKGSMGGLQPNNSRGKLISPAPRAGGIPAFADDSADEGKMHVTFNPKGAGLYRCELLLTSPIDVRVYNIEVTVTAPDVEPTLEFTAPARQTISQDIPIVNGTTEPWTLRATLSGKYFSGAPDLVVNPKSTANYQLAFTPPWICDSPGRLELVNSRTNEKFGYELRGTGEEPLAEDIITIECQARAGVEQKLSVRNYTADPQVYTVESDLPNISGASSITVLAGGRADYLLKINPQLGGTYNGSVTFVASGNKRFQWYAIEVNATSPKPEEELKVTAQVRKAAAIQIGITNPLDEVLVFDVELMAIGLIGERSLTLGPKETATYEFMYAPLQAGQQVGAVSFVNEKAGEFWYKLVLTAEPPPVVTLPSLTCEAGNSTSTTLTIDNPTDEELFIQGRSTNGRNFTIKPSSFRLGAYESKEVTVTYAPSSINEPQTGDIIFTNEMAGEWLYKVSGTGTEPRSLPEVVVSAAIRQRFQSMINFRNPFSIPLVLSAVLTDTTGAFSLQQTRADETYTVAPFTMLQLPYTFAPTAIMTHRASLALRAAGTTIVFTYPLRGIAEGPIVSAVRELKCEARSSITDQAELRLDGLPVGAWPVTETFTAEIVGDNDADTNYARRTVRATLPQPSLNNGDVPLVCTLIFEPMKPGMVKAALMITKASGGRWRFPLWLVATPAPVDAVIRLEALISQTASYPVTIMNPFENYGRYTAFYSPESAVEFKVSPREGVLEPRTTATPTQLVVSFTPKSYGKPLSGILIVQSEDMQWSFEVRGTHPKYTPPVAAQSVIDHRRVPEASATSAPTAAATNGGKAPTPSVNLSAASAAAPSQVSARSLRSGNGGNTSSRGAIAAPVAPSGMSPPVVVRRRPGGNNNNGGTITIHNAAA